MPLNYGDGYDQWEEIISDINEFLSKERLVAQRNEIGRYEIHTLFGRFKKLLKRGVYFMENFSDCSVRHFVLASLFERVGVPSKLV